MSQVSIENFPRLFGHRVKGREQAGRERQFCLHKQAALRGDTRRSFYFISLGGGLFSGFLVYRREVVRGFAAMEDQIREEFLSNNFTLEDEETAEKCMRSTTLYWIGLCRW